MKIVKIESSFYFQVLDKQNMEFFHKNFLYKLHWNGLSTIINLIMDVILIIFFPSQINESTNVTWQPSNSLKWPLKDIKILKFWYFSHVLSLNVIAVTIAILPIFFDDHKLSSYVLFVFFSFLLYLREKAFYHQLDKVYQIESNIV